MPNRPRSVDQHLDHAGGGDGELAALEQARFSLAGGVLHGDEDALGAGGQVHGAADAAALAIGDAPVGEVAVLGTTS